VSDQLFYSQALKDFQQARRKAEIEGLIARLTGKSAHTKLLSYEEVRKMLKVREGSRRELRDIPLDDIVGSAGRYADFTRSFLPRQDSIRERWARVMAKTTGLEGLPPISVYQVGEVYFVLDGNHRVSVARQLDASHIQAYVTEVRTKVPLDKDTYPDDLIIKAEYIDFLETTNLDQSHPDIDFSVTAPGKYPVLEEHIAVHRYYMGIEQQQKIPFEEAADHWCETVYLPVVEIIRERGILYHFPERTETDLYIWLSEHHAELEETLGWKISREIAASDLVESIESETLFSQVKSVILDTVTPDVLEPGPPPGEWRKAKSPLDKKDILFSNILVTISGEENGWYSLDQALTVAQHEGEGTHLHGLHIVSKDNLEDVELKRPIQEKFERRCAKAGVSGDLVFETGPVAQQICNRSRWVDLVITTLTYPPGERFLDRLSSGFHTMIRRCPRPVLAVPRNVTQLRRALLAYDNSAKAREALYVSAYLAGKWGIPLSVVTAIQNGYTTRETLDSAKKYIEQQGIQAEYLTYEDIAPGEAILQAADDQQCELIMIGGYGASPFIEVILGSTVDHVLRGANVPILICR
jgi:nucleotide-binding universal stress UspA family protein